MMLDCNTNFIYFADCLPKQYFAFYQQLMHVVMKCKIKFDFLPAAKHIGIADYMPIQLGLNHFMQSSELLIDNLEPLERKKISKAETISHRLDLPLQTLNIQLRRANLVTTTDKIIICDTVFKDNIHIEAHLLVNTLRELFQVNQIIVIPTAVDNVKGNANGMLRFINSDTVLVNDYSKEDISFQYQLLNALENAKLNFITLPYHPYFNRNIHEVNGIYINYLETEQAIILPNYAMPTDEKAFSVLHDIFNWKTIATVDCNDIAHTGNGLNNIAWNIKKLNAH